MELEHDEVEPDVVEEHREEKDEVEWHREESNQGKRIRMPELQSPNFRHDKLSRI